MSACQRIELSTLNEYFTAAIVARALLRLARPPRAAWRAEPAARNAGSQEAQAGEEDVSEVCDVSCVTVSACRPVVPVCRDVQ